MKIESVDWKLRGLELVVTAVPDFAESDAWLDEILDRGGWRQNALFEMVEMAFPRFEFATLENGLSAKQLGCIIGQIHSTLNRFGALFARIADAYGRFAESTKRMAQIVERVDKFVVSENRREWDTFRSGISASITFDPINRADLRELVEFKNRYRRAITKVVELASREVGQEAEPFFRAYAEALAVPALGDDCRFVTKDRRIEAIMGVLLICGDELTKGLNGVPDLHRVLSIMLPGQLTRDESSLEWDRQRDVVESVCRTLKLKLRGRGRPRKK